jgi:hypothetical protein
MQLILVGGGVVVLGLIAVAVIPHLWRSEQQRLRQDSSGQPSSKVSPAIADSKIAKGPQPAADSPRPADSAKDELLKVEKLSQNVQDNIGTVFKLLMHLEAAPPSSNQFVEQRRKEELASARASFRKLISTALEPGRVIGWSFLAGKVQQDGPGQATLTGLFFIVTGEDGQVIGSLDGVFRVSNQECLGKVKTLKTPCFVKVYGTVRGKVKEQFETFYTLEFDLDDIR